MGYFSKDYLDFFKELAANNNKDWFDKNRKRYASNVKEPFKLFISDLIAKISKEDTEVQIEAKDAIFRINRDIRFSKDKTPYKLNNSAIISKMGRKDKNYPGIYIELSPDKLRFYGGVYAPDSKQVQKIREAIVNKNEEFNRILGNNDFVEKFGQIHGEKNKRIPKEFLKAAMTQPLLFNKQWYYYSELSPDIILTEDLMETILDQSRSATPMKLFLKEALYGENQEFL